MPRIVLPMLPDRFDAALRCNGPALARWPEQERGAALALLRLSGRARRSLADALDFPGDGPVDAAALARMQRGLRLRLAASQSRTDRRREARLGWAALAACAVAGVLVGGAVDRAEAADAFGALLTSAFWAVEQ